MKEISLNITIIISFYAARSRSHLLRLLQGLQNFAPNVIVVVNTDGPEDVLRDQNLFRVVYNPNVGMNIGAWHRGFTEDPNSDLYLFLQDECYIRKEHFVSVIASRFRADQRLGMLGETINRKWDQPWPVLRESSLNRIEPDHFVDTLPSRRVETYLNAMFSWGIEPGATGSHLRSLVWAFPGNVMRELGGFPIGQNKGDCIAAEIAVSRKILSLGYRFDQIALNPFSCFGHSEWREDGLSKKN